MQNDYLNTEIILESDNNQLLVGETRKGKIFFTPKMNLFVNSLGYQFVMEARGNMRNIDNSVIKKTLIRNKKLIKGKTYQFEIKIKGETPSFQGENISLNWTLQSFINLRSDYFLKIRNKELKKRGMTHFYDLPKDLLVESLRINMLESNLLYQVRNTERELETSSILSWTILLGGMALSFLILSKFEVDNLLSTWLGCFSALLFFTVIPYYFKTGILESMNVNTSFLGNNQFAVVLGLSKNIKNIKKVKVSYSVIENVRDRRGDGNVIRTKVIYKSPLQEKSQISQNSDMILDFPDLAYDFIFDFPDKNIPTMMLPNDLEIEWKVDIKVYFVLGLRSKFTKLIDVSREVE